MMRGDRASALAGLAVLLSIGGCEGIRHHAEGPPPDGSIDAAGDIPRSGLHLWLRADVGVAVSSGMQVSQWLDQSGNGRNASMATPTRQPSLVRDALNHLPVIRFFGAQSMSLDTFATPTMFSVFVVGKNSLPEESFSMILGPGGNSPNNQLRWEDGSHVLFVGTGNRLPATTVSTGDTRVYQALSARYDGATLTVYRDGGAVSSSSFVTAGPWTLASVGSYYSSYFLVGDLAEVVLYDRALSEKDRAAVDSYLRAKYKLP